MSYTPKHAAPRRNLRRAVGVSAVSVATAAVGVGLSSAPAHADGAVWDRMAQCEAGGNWHINTGNGYYGGLQFNLQSWRGAGGMAYASRPDLASREQQIAAGQRLMAMQGPGAWPVCSIRSGLTRGSGGTSGPAPVATPRAVAQKPAAKKWVPRASAPARKSAAAKAVAPKVSAAAKAPTVAKPTSGRLKAADSTMVQTWAFGTPTGVWSAQAIKGLQTKLGVNPTGRTDAATIKATEKLVGMKPSGLKLFTQPVLNKLAAYARTQLAQASLKSLVSAVEGGSVSPATVALATRPAAYR